jgi:hypothetical protein
MPPKKGGFPKQASRIGNRISDRAKNFVKLARSGNYDQTQLAKDVGGSILDVVDFWGSLFGSGASPAVPVVDLGPQPDAVWKAGGQKGGVVLDNPVPDDAKWPLGGGGGNSPLLSLRPVDGGAAVRLDLLSVTVEDDDGLQLSVVVQDTGNPVIASGEYFGNLYYTSASLGAGQYFAAIIRAAVS